MKSLIKMKLRLEYISSFYEHSQPAEKASEKRGMKRRKISANWCNELDLNNIAAYINPKNVLPTSPIKTLAGLQLKNRKPNKEKVIGKKASSYLIDIVNKIIIIQLQTNPSIPSIKFIVLITPTKITK